jgi:dynein heavy chain
MHTAKEHLSLAITSRHYLETQRRYNYITPKSYLELISFFKYLLENKQAHLQRLIDSLDVGLSTLQKTSQDVAKLQKDLKITMEMVAKKNVMRVKLIKEMRGCLMPRFKKKALSWRLIKQMKSPRKL